MLQSPPRSISYHSWYKVIVRNAAYNFIETSSSSRWPESTVKRRTPSIKKNLQLIHYYSGLLPGSRCQEDKKVTPTETKNETMQPRSLEDTATHRRQGNPPGDPAWDHRARTSHQHMLPRKDSSNYKGTTPQTHQAGANLIAVIFVTNWIVQLKI